MNVDNRDRFVALDNEYLFHCYCSQKSIDAFDLTIANDDYPSRFYLILIGVAEILYSPFYLVKKIYEIVVHLWHFSNINEIKGKSGHFSNLSDTLGLITLQILTPLLCTVIRISAAMLGILYPRLAIEGWKIAETGEQTSNRIWASLKTDISTNPSEDLACEEIYPTNAIYYLGHGQTYTLLAKDPVTLIRIEREIHVHFRNLLKRIYQTHPLYFQKLLGFDANPKMFLSQDTKEILLRLNRLRNERFPALKEGNQAFFDLIFPRNGSAHLSLEEIHRLFMHVSLNLQSIASEFMRKIGIIHDLTRLTDLFSLYFKFGRAHFPQEKNRLLPYIRV